MSIIRWTTSYWTSIPYTQLELWISLWALCLLFLENAILDDDELTNKRLGKKIYKQIGSRSSASQVQLLWLPLIYSPSFQHNILIWSPTSLVVSWLQKQNEIEKCNLPFFYQYIKHYTWKWSSFVWNCYSADACLVDCSFCGADLRSAHLQVHQTWIINLHN